MPLRAIIVDDEKYAIAELKYLLEEYSDFEVCGEAMTAEDALSLVVRERPDIVFLDIDLHGKSGVDVAKEIRRLNGEIHIVFATAYSNYAVEAFDVEAFDYILKPFEDRRIIETIERLKLHIKPKNAPDVITAWKKDRMGVLSPDDIAYFTTSEDKTLIKSTKGEYLTNLTLSSLEKRLENHMFMRTHKSFLVNLKHIKEIIPWFNHTYLLVMKGYEDDEVPVSRTYIKEFKSLMNIE